MSVTTGPGSDVIVIDESSSSTNSLITVQDLEDEDTIRFYNPDTLKQVDVPFSVARDTIKGLKSVPDLVTPEVQIGILELGAFFALICDETSDLGTTCWQMDLADADNQTLA